MAAPAIVTVYPADSDTGIPVGSILHIDFDRGVDASTCRNSVVLYGSDFDLASGPNSAIWVDKPEGLNPQYLRSPGFKGIAEVDLQLLYVDLSSGTELSLDEVDSESYELGYGSAGIGHRLKITPRQQLAPDVQYTLYVLGDPDGIGAGISSRTVFDVLPDVANQSDTGLLSVYGGYSRTTADRVILTITEGGAIGTAKYSYYYESEGAGSAVQGGVTSRRYKRLKDGLQIRFSGSGFTAADVFRTRVEPPERLATSTRVVFTTNDGSYTEAPDSPSTPATSTPPATVLPSAPTEELDSTVTMGVLSSEPPNGAYQMDRNLREFVVTFTDLLDSSSVTNATVRVYKYPVSGIFDGQPRIQELSKVLSVQGDTLTIKI